MKKLIIRLSIVAVVLLIAAIVVGALFLDSLVKKGVETVGPQITKTEVKLSGVSLSILSGSGALKGFTLGNPTGFNSTEAMKVDNVEVAVAPMSVLADKVHVKYVRVIAPEINFEAAGLDVRANNLSKILENVQGTASETPAATPAEKSSGASKKLQVDDFLLSNAKVKVSSTAFAGKTGIVSIPDIHFTNLGSGPDGITAAELTKKVLDELVPVVLAAAQQALGDLSKGAILRGAAGTNTTQAVGKATKSITDLLNKKKE